MDRRQALSKATITTTDATAGLLDPEQGRAFIRALKESTSLSTKIRQEVRTASSGEINKLATGSRIIRSATENADDGYRVGATFDTVEYTTRKIRLPWEVTEDVFHENIEGEGLEADLTSEMTTQFALDLEDLEINGDTTSLNAFVQINDGILKTRGRWFSYHTGRREIRAMATLHPAYLLRQPLQKRLAWRDFLSLRKALDLAKSE